MAVTTIPLVGGRQARIELSLQEVDVAGNRSRWAYAAWFNNNGSSVNGSGNTYALEGLVNRGATAFNITAGTGWTLLASGENEWVPHNADGSRDPVGIRLTIVSDNPYVGNGTGVAQDPAPKIPRATTAIIPNSGWFDPGVELTISLPRASSAYTHDVRWAFGALSGQTAGLAGSGNGAGTSIKWTPPLSMLNQIPNNPYGSGHIEVTTKQGSTVIGTTRTTFYASAQNVYPTVSGLTISDDNPTVQSTVGAFVQGLSLLRATVNAAGVYGSTIKTRTFTFDGITAASGGVVQVDQAGNRPWTATATDSRGQTADTSGTLNVLAYAPPSISSAPVRRAVAAGTANDQGTYLRVDLTGAIASLIVSSAQKNGMTVRAFTRQTGTSTWIARNVITPTGTSYNSNFVISGGGIFDATKSYDVRIELADKFGTAQQISQVSAAKIALDINGNAGVGIGKYHEQGALDVAGDIYQNGAVVLDASDTATVAQIIAGTPGRVVTADSLFAATSRGYAERTATNMTTTTTTPAAISGLSAAVSAPAAATVEVVVGINCYSSDTSDVVGVELRRNGTKVRTWTARANSGNAGTAAYQTFTTTVAVPSGTSTFSVYLLRAAGSGTVTLAPSTDAPAFVSAKITL